MAAVHQGRCRLCLACACGDKAHFSARVPLCGDIESGKKRADDFVSHRPLCFVTRVKRAETTFLPCRCLLFPLPLVRLPRSCPCRLRPSAPPRLWGRRRLLSLCPPWWCSCPRRSYRNGTNLFRFCCPYGRFSLTVCCAWRGACSCRWHLSALGSRRSGSARLLLP